MSTCREGCQTESKLRFGLCPKHYQRIRRHGDVSAYNRRRLGGFYSWHHVLITNTCWLWTGPQNARGYGRCGVTTAHRAVYTRLVGPVPAGLELDHLCMVRNCVRPDHLEPVTHAENMRRAYEARRAVAA